MLCHGLQSFLEDGTNVIEANLQEHLGPYSFYLELDLVQPSMHADLQAEEACELSKDGDVCPEILDRQLDHVDLLTGRRLFLCAVVDRWWILSHDHSSSLLLASRGSVCPTKYMMLL